MLFDFPDQQHKQSYTNVMKLSMEFCLATWFFRSLYCPNLPLLQNFTKDLLRQKIQKITKQRRP